MKGEKGGDESDGVSREKVCSDEGLMGFEVR